jgi:hypothetical protein
VERNDMKSAREKRFGIKNNFKRLEMLHANKSKEDVKEIKTKRGFSVSCGSKKEGRRKVVFCSAFFQKERKPKSTLYLYMYDSSLKSFLFVPFSEDILE